MLPPRCGVRRIVVDRRLQHADSGHTILMASFWCPVRTCGSSRSMFPRGIIHRMNALARGLLK